MTPPAIEYPRHAYTPRATYVKSPQVPSNFTKVNFSNTPNILTPPLPFTPTLPNIGGSTLGIPYTQNSSMNKCQNLNPMRNNSFFHSTIDISNNLYIGNSANPRYFPSTPMYSAFSSSNPNVNNIKKSFSTINKVLAPPLPTLLPNPPVHHFDISNYTSNFPNFSTNSPNLSSSNSQSSETNSSGSTSGKKHQAKVKFSDTVTAFIVPEIKRPQRPPPPPHVTDPQKELADSLPLCHPNEDYLKDFAPVRKEESGEEADGSQPPKIKVVHFGVV